MNVLLKKLKDLFDLGDGRWFGVAVDRQWGDEEEMWWFFRCVLQRVKPPVCRGLLVGCSGRLGSGSSVG